MSKKVVTTKRAKKWSQKRAKKEPKRRSQFWLFFGSREPRANFGSFVYSRKKSQEPRAILALLFWLFFGSGAKSQEPLQALIIGSVSEIVKNANAYKRELRTDLDNLKIYIKNRLKMW
jgi:hypothetical protein